MGAQRQILAICMKGFPFFGSSLQMSQAIAGEAARRDAHYVCLDFGGIHGADSTAAGQLKFLVFSLLRDGREVLCSSASEDLKWLLVANEVPGTDHIFNTLDDSLQYVEHQVMRRRGVVPRALKPEAACVGELLLDLLMQSSKPSQKEIAAAQCLETRFKRMRFRPGEALYRSGERADGLYIVSKGSVKLMSFSAPQSSSDSPGKSNAMRPDTDPAPDTADDGLVEADDGDGKAYEPPRIVMPGSLIGVSAFCAEHAYGRSAVAEKFGCVAYKLTRPDLEELECSEHIDDASAAVFLQKALLR